jgi:hypothetical protein
LDKKSTLTRFFSHHTKKRHDRRILKSRKSELKDKNFGSTTDNPVEKIDKRHVVDQ